MSDTPFGSLLRCVVSLALALHSQRGDYFIGTQNTLVSCAKVHYYLRDCNSNHLGLFVLEAATNELSSFLHALLAVLAL